MTGFQTSRLAGTSPIDPPDPASKRNSCRGRSIIPGVFNAAGLIVPEPSIISPPMPFIEVETVWGAEYMTTTCSSFRQEAVARAVAPTVLERESARSRFLVEDCDEAATRVI